MKRIFLQLKQLLRNERGEITFFACFFVVGIVMLISFLLLYASIRITCINIRNGAKMELNNLICIEQGEDAVSQEHLNNFPQKVYWPRLAEVLESNGLAAEVTAQGIQVSW